jgi:hypothetical protein
MQIDNLSKDKVWDYENGFYWFSSPTRVNKLLAHYEIYKKITGLPGDILELGVFKGASLIRFASFRNSLENDFSRKIIGFDSFGKFPRSNISSKDDLNFIDDFEKEAGDSISKADLEAILENKGFRNIELQEGDIFETLKNFIQENPQARISLLHLDMDVAEPTQFALEKLYEKVVSGGLIVFDDYNSVSGETEVVDQFVKEKGLKLEKGSFYAVPAFVVKP